MIATDRAVWTARVNTHKVLAAAPMVVLIGAFFALDLGRYFDLEYFKSRQAAFDIYYAAHPLRTAAIYFGVYVVVAALSLPGSVVMTLAEANQYAAGNWKRARAPQRLLRRVERHQAWMTA